MTNEEALNFILSHACGLLEDEDVERLGFQEFDVELHCHTFTVRARPLGNLRYQVISISQKEFQPVEATFGAG